jgi:hypothetical protein
MAANAQVLLMAQLAHRPLLRSLVIRLKNAAFRISPSPAEFRQGKFLILFH